MRAVANLDLTPRRQEVLQALSGGPLTYRELAGRLGIKSNSPTHLIAPLVRLRLVKRGAGRKSLQLTSSGQEWVSAHPDPQLSLELSGAAPKVSGGGMS